MVALQRSYNVHTIGPRFGTPWVAKPRSEFACQNRGPYIHITYKIVNLHNNVCKDHDFARTAVLQPTHVQVHVLCTAEYGTDRLGNTHVAADHVHTGCDVGHSSHVAAVE